MSLVQSTSADKTQLSKDWLQI